MKSVRIALETFWSSSSLEVRVAAASATSSWPPWIASISFSAASKQRKAPPSISSGGSSQGAKALSASAAGSRNSNLLRNDPRAIFQMIGSSRSGDRPMT